MGGGNPGAQASAAAGQAQGAANQVAGEMSPLVASLTGGINLPGINQSVFGYLMNPNQTMLSQNYGNLNNFFTGEMNNGLSPAVINNAFNNFQTQSQQGINSIVNQLGSSVPNLPGMIGDLNMQSMEGRAQLGSNLAAENQQVKQQGAAGVQGLSSALDSQQMQMMLAALQGAQGATGMSLDAFGNMFNQYQNAANQDTGYATQAAMQSGNWFNSLLNAGIGFGMMGGMPGLAGLFGLGGGKGNTSIVSAGGPGISGLLNGLPIGL